MCCLLGSFVSLLDSLLDETLSARTPERFVQLVRLTNRFTCWALMRQTLLVAWTLGQQVARRPGQWTCSHELNRAIRRFWVLCCIPRPAGSCPDFIVYFGFVWSDFAAVGEFCCL